MHTATSIKITMSENAELDELKPVFKSFKEADSELGRISLGMRESRGYDKTFFAVTFSDGTVYESRIDLSRDVWKIGEHCKLFLQWSLDYPKAPRAKCKRLLKNYIWD